MKNHPVIGPEDLEFDAPARAVTASALEVSGSSPAGYVEKPLRQVVLDHIMETLKHTGGNKEKSARILNISVMTLYDTLDRGRLPRNFGHGKPLFSPGEEQLRSEIMRVLEATQGDISRAALQLQFGDARELVSEMDRLWIPRRHGSPAEESGWGQDVRETTANGPESPGNFCRPG
jgi:transcriptional regulator with GAF, ATPase, and Fis domain